MHLRLLSPLGTALITVFIALTATASSAQVVDGNGGFQEWQFDDDGSACSTGHESDDNIVWGTDDSVSSCSDSDDNIVWGTALDGAEGDDNIVWGTDDRDDNIVWGTAVDGAEGDDNIVWGTGEGDDNIVWGTRSGFWR